MYGDFSRNPDRPGEHISAVLFNQGKPLIEADMNEAFRVADARVTRLVYSLMDVKTVKGIRMKVPTSIRTGWKLFQPSGSTRLALRAGTMLFGNFEISTTQKIVLNKFKKPDMSVAHYIVDPTDNESPGGDALDVGPYVVALVANQRQLLQSEIEERSRVSASLYGANFHRVEWRLELFGPGVADHNDLRFRNRFDLAPTLAVSGFNAEKYRGRLLRLELHSYTSTGGFEFKLGIDNAQSFTASAFSAGAVTLRYAGAESDLPQQDEYVEVELPNSWGMDANPLLKVLSRQGKTVTVQGLTAFDSLSDQLRRWKKPTTNPVKDVSNPTQTITFDVDSSTFVISGTDLDNQLRPGDYWLFTSDGKVVGQRRHAYYAPLGTATLAANGDLTSVDSDLRTNVLLASNSDDLPQSFEAASHLLTAKSANPKNILDELPCSQVCDDVRSAGVRRWLASMTFSELSALSPREVRQRIQRDLGVSEKELCALDDDLNRIESNRRRVQQISSLVA